MDQPAIMVVKLMVADFDANADVSIVPMTPAHVESFHHTLDIVARERKDLSLQCRAAIATNSLALRHALV
jgi:hypothetical protein